MNILWLTLAVLVWGVFHSILASGRVKEWLERLIGKKGMLFYRLGYNLFSVISFMPILWLLVVLPDRSLYQFPAPWLYLAAIGQGLAVLMLIVGVLQTDTLSFIGLRQILETRESSSKLVTSGLYRFMRHPLYTAGLLFIWLTPKVSLNSFVVFVVSTVYIMVGTVFEERKLLREFGLSYAEYRSVTPMLVPGMLFTRNK